MFRFFKNHPQVENVKYVYTYAKTKFWANNPAFNHRCPSRGNAKLRNGVLQIVYSWFCAKWNYYGTEKRFFV